jgi:hypothetical protein
MIQYQSLDNSYLTIVVGGNKATAKITTKNKVQ